MTGTEIPLDGGNMSSGVVRVGDTVRRPGTVVRPSRFRPLRGDGLAGSVRIPAELGLLMR